MSEMPGANDRLKAAVRNAAPVPPHLETRIRARVRTTPPMQPWAMRLAWAGTAAAVALVGVLGVYQQGRFRLSEESQESYISKVTSWVSPLMSVGLGNHIHCSVFGKNPTKPAKIDELMAEIGPRYEGLIPVVRKHVPERFQMTTAHRCDYRNREFARTFEPRNGDRGERSAQGQVNRALRPPHIPFRGLHLQCLGLGSRIAHHERA